MFEVSSFRLKYEAGIKCNKTITLLEPFDSPSALKYLTVLLNFVLSLSLSLLVQDSLNCDFSILCARKL